MTTVDVLHAGYTGERVGSTIVLVRDGDATIVAEAPKLAGWLEPMRARLAETLGVAVEQVSVKAKRAEQLGALGRDVAGLSLAAHADWTGWSSLTSAACWPGRSRR